MKTKIDETKTIPFKVQEKLNKTMKRVKRIMPLYDLKINNVFIRLKRMWYNVFMTAIALFFLMGCGDNPVNNGNNPPPVSNDTNIILVIDSIILNTDTVGRNCLNLRYDFLKTLYANDSFMISFNTETNCGDSINYFIFDKFFNLFNGEIGNGFHIFYFHRGHDVFFDDSIWLQYERLYSPLYLKIRNFLIKRIS